VALLAAGFFMRSHLMGGRADSLISLIFLKIKERIIPFYGMVYGGRLKIGAV